MEWWDNLDYELDWRLSGDQSNNREDSHRTTHDADNTTSGNDATTSNDDLSTLRGDRNSVEAASLSQEEIEQERTALAGGHFTSTPTHNSLLHVSGNQTNEEEIGSSRFSSTRPGKYDMTRRKGTLSTDRVLPSSSSSCVASDRSNHVDSEKKFPSGFAPDERILRSARHPPEKNEDDEIDESETASTPLALAVSRKQLGGAFLASPDLHYKADSQGADSVTGDATLLTLTGDNGIVRGLNDSVDESINEQPRSPFRNLDSSSLRTRGVSSPLSMTSPTLGQSTSSLGSQHDVSDFEVPLPLKDWDDNDPHAKPFDKHLMNCHGIFHVRVLRALRLPCPVGSSVCAAMSLPPWSGRVRTDRVAAFSSTLAHGVCVRWDQQTSDTAGLCSMVNAWSSDESPVPSIKIELMFSPLGIGLFEVSMCTLNLGCEVLMQSPDTWKSEWCQATMSAPHDSGARKEFKIGSRVPLIHVEAMFSPTLARKDSSNLLVTSEENSASTDIRIFQNDEPADEHRFVIQPPPTVARDSASDDLTETSTIKSAGGEVASVATNVPIVMNSESKPHHLRIQSFWMPASCHVCARIIVGRKGFHCEQCGIYCCKDCRLNVDLQLPCGSESARAAVEESIQSKLTVGNLMAIVAPLDASSGNKLPASKPNHIEQLADVNINGPSPIHRLDDFDEADAIGRLNLEVIRACLFEQVLPADKDVSTVDTGIKLRRGDYYARVTCSGTNSTARTRTLQNVGMPKFDADEMRFYISHYGMEFRLEVIDASTDMTVGTSLITTHGLLQDQRDHSVSEGGTPLLQALNGPICYKSKRNIRLELRTGVKSGYSSDFFVSSKASTAGTGGKQQPGEISGWIEVRVGLEEHIKRLYAQENPLLCKPRPPDELNMNNFQIHLARIKLLIEDFAIVFEQYQYLVSWKNPLVTGSSFFVFLWFCLRFNAEYSGSLPVLALLAWMMHLAANRGNGHPKKRFVQREIEACRKAGNVALNYSLHRPVGTIDVSVQRGKDLISLDFGLPGSTGCQIYWDPVRFADETTKGLLTKIDISAKSKHEIGFTDAVYGADPVWSDHNESTELKRLKQLLPNDGDFFEASPTSKKRANISFPILQPFHVVKSTADDTNNLLDASLSPWDTSPGAIVVEVRFLDILNNLPGFNDVLGEVAIPFSSLVENGEIRGWYQVLQVGTTRVIRGVGGNEGEDESSEADRPQRGVPMQQIYLSLKWRPPRTIIDPSPGEREASFAIQEEFIRSSIISRRNRIDLVETSIGALNTALGLGGNVQVIQNSLGAILDTIEGIRNAFNFTDPYKSSVLFVLLMAVWLILVIIPSRYVMLCGGLAQYSVTFTNRFGNIFQRGKEAAKQYGSAQETANFPKKQKIETASFPILIWITNAFRGLPTQEDLRKTYFWESRRRGFMESEKYANQKRRSRLRQLWKAQWHNAVKLRINSDGKESQWENVFAIIQGHRFLWWRSVLDFDNGELPSGRVFLSGHAGLTGPSPLEMRELLAEELPLTVTVFGRGISGQERVMLLASDAAMKESLENAILGAAADKAD